VKAVDSWSGGMQYVVCVVQCTLRVDVHRRLIATWAHEWQSSVQRNCWSKYRAPNQ